MSDIKYESADQLINISHIRSLEQPDSTFSSRAENRDTPLVYRTTRLPRNQILTEASIFPTMAQNHHKTSLSLPSLYIMAFQFSSPFPSCLMLHHCPFSLLAFHLLPFPSPPPPTLAAEHELAVVRLLDSCSTWRISINVAVETKPDSFYFPFLPSVLACGCSWVAHDPASIRSENPSLHSHKARIWILFDFYMSILGHHYLLIYLRPD